MKKQNYFKLLRVYLFSDEMEVQGYVFRPSADNRIFSHENGTNIITQE